MGSYVLEAKKNQRKTSHSIISKLGIKLDCLTRTCYLIVHTTNILPEKFKNKATNATARNTHV